MEDEVDHWGMMKVMMWKLRLMMVMIHVMMLMDDHGDDVEDEVMKAMMLKLKLVAAPRDFFARTFGKN